jgi:tRNA A-37 threonylcarbamoyl transferase component Bud32/tetratricopeptide (TPR) repeat protein
VTANEDTLPLNSSAAAPETERVAIGSVAAGRYRIERFIASGGMGEVYAARDLVLDVTVALKTLKPELEKSADAIARLRREITLARAVTNAHVCRVFDVGEHAGRVFLTMELLDGPTLADRIKQGRLPLTEVERIAGQLVAGLGALHRESIVHRDFKTANVILVGERAVITDFGLALSTTGNDAKLTATDDASLIGTPAYMAPEQVEARPATASSDIYALGVVLFELLTGTLPFIEDNPLATATARLKREPPVPSSLRGDVPARWDAIVATCMARDPANRFATVDDVLTHRRSRRWFLAAGAAAVGGALLGGMKLGGLLDEDAAPRVGGVVALVPATGDGAWQLDPWRTAITVDLRDALSTAGVPLLFMQQGGLGPALEGPGSRLLDTADPTAAALKIEGVTTAVTIALKRTATHAEIAMAIAGSVRQRPRRFQRPVDEVALLVDDVALAISRALGYGAIRRARDARAINATLYERYGAALSWAFRPRGEEDWTAIAEGRHEPARAPLVRLTATSPALARAAAAAAEIEQIDGEQHEEPSQVFEHLDLSDELTARALAIDPDQPLAHAVRGSVAMNRYDWKLADQLTARAMTLAPTHERVAYHRGMVLFLSGRFDDAIAHAEETHARSPKPRLGRAMLTWQYYYARRYDDVIRIAEPVWSSFDRTHYAEAVWASFLALTYAEMARYDDALRIAEELRPVVDPYTLGGLVPVYVLAGRVEQARTIRERIKDQVALGVQVIMADALGETEVALDLLERVVASHNIHALFIKVERFSTRLRSEPRFQRLLATVGA